MDNPFAYHSEDKADKSHALLSMNVILASLASIEGITISREGCKRFQGWVWRRGGKLRLLACLEGA
jgi:hypothetical protein